MEALFPSGAFAGPDAEENARNTSKARCIMFFFYLAFLVFFAYQLFVLFFLGRVDVATSTYKMNSVEAPSFAVCPFWPNAAIVSPPNTSEQDLFQVVKYGRRGAEQIPVVPHVCKFDRVCVCVDLWDFGPDDGPVMFRDHRISETENIGATSEASESAVRFKERIEVKTNITDGSNNETLKIGFFDSVDEAPQFFYMHQGAYVLGKLELEVWNVKTFTFATLYEAIRDWLTFTDRGSKEGLVKDRHMFTYTSQEVAHVLHEETKPDESTFSYQMKNFFVEHKVAAETSFSLYAIFSVLVIIALRGVVVDNFKAVMFPSYDPHKDARGVKRREMSDHADCCSEVCCCFCCFQRRRAPGETTRLLPDA